MKIKEFIMKIKVFSRVAIQLTNVPFTVDPCATTLRRPQILFRNSLDRDRETSLGTSLGMKRDVSRQILSTF